MVFSWGSFILDDFLKTGCSESLSLRSNIDFRCYRQIKEYPETMCLSNMKHNNIWNVNTQWEMKVSVISLLLWFRLGNSAVPDQTCSVSLNSFNKLFEHTTKKCVIWIDPKWLIKKQNLNILIKPYISFWQCN